MDKARKRLSDVIQERTRVLDLIYHAIPSISASAGHVALRSGNFNTSYNVRPASVNGMSPMQDVDPLGAYTPEADAALKDARAARERYVLKTIFIKMPDTVIFNSKQNVYCYNLRNNNINSAIHVLYYRSISLRKDAANTLEKNDKMMKSALKSVNDGLMQKLAETVTLKVQLSLI